MEKTIFFLNSFPIRVVFFFGLLLFLSDTLNFLGLYFVSLTGKNLDRIDLSSNKKSISIEIINIKKLVLVRGKLIFPRQHLNKHHVALAKTLNNRSKGKRTF